MARSYLVRRPPEPPFLLASGATSWHYFDCERTTTYAPALPLLGEAFYRLLDRTVTAVGGLTRGADPIADAVAFYSVVRGERPVNAFSVRKEPKSHGTGRWLEGSVEPGETVAVVDDVVTSGGSVIRALERCREEGLRVAQVLVLVDREEQDGMARVRAAAGPDVPVLAIFRFSELVAECADPAAT